MVDNIYFHHSPFEKIKFNIGEFIIDKYINLGRFGHYHFAYKKKNPRVYFLKIFKKSIILECNKKDILYHEIELYKKFQETDFLPTIIGITTNDPRYLGFLFDFIPGGTFRNLLIKQKSFSLEESKFYFAQMLNILTYFHNNNYIYRDLKPENILIKNNGYLTLLDISLIKQINNKDLTYTLCGTPNYLSPEMILNQGYNKSIDIWAMGVILYEMIVGIDPFHSYDPMLVYQNIITNKLKFPKIIDKDAKSLIKKILNPNPNKRLGCLRRGVTDIKEHRLFNDFNWNNIEESIIEAPFIPKLNDYYDLDYYIEDKSNKKIFEIFEKKKEILEKEKNEREIEKEKQPRKKKDKKIDIEGIEIIDSETEGKEIDPDDDPFLKW